MSAPFIKFSDLDTATQERTALAPRPRVHIEPVVLHRAGTTDTMLAMHLQIDDSHALMLADDLDDFLDQFQKAVQLLEAAR